MTELATGARPGRDDAADVERQLESYRGELTGYAYRMLGSAFEAEDAVQETMVRAWRAYDRFEGRSSLRSWLYRIATNVCFDMLDGRQRRARPMDMGPSQHASADLGDVLPEVAWIQPIPDSRVLAEGGDPAAVAESRESVRLAFIATLQHLPPRQRAVLILREVLQLRAAEVAELLGSSVASVNSALQRARATLDAQDVTMDDASHHVDEEYRELLDSYVDAFERYDMDRLTSLLSDDATWSMPPYALWLRGHEDIRAWCLGMGIGCEGSRLVPTHANGAPAFGQYRKAATPGRWEPWSLQVLEITDGVITGVCFFLDTASLFPMFGLPDHLEA